MTKAIRRDAIDPSVAALLSHREERETDAKLPKKEREKKAKEQKKAQARLPGRIGLDLPPALKDNLLSLSEELGVPASQVVAFILQVGIESYRGGQLDMKSYLQPCRSPRYKFRLVLPTEKE
ncbi:MAG: hypothetical protein AB9888_13055 [Bacteroidales bacterium]